MSATFTYQTEYPVPDLDATVSAALTAVRESFVDDLTTRDMVLVGDLSVELTGETIRCSATVRALSGRVPAAVYRHRERVTELAGQGMTDRQIGDTIGLTPKYVYTIRHRYNITAGSKVSA